MLRLYARPSRIVSFAPRLNVRARQVTGLVASGDTASEEGGIVVDEAAYLAGLITSHARATEAATSGPPPPRGLAEPSGGTR